MMGNSRRLVSKGDMNTSNSVSRSLVPWLSAGSLRGQLGCWGENFPPCLSSVQKDEAVGQTRRAPNPWSQLSHST